MALEAVVFPPEPLAFTMKGPFAIGGTSSAWDSRFGERATAEEHKEGASSESGLVGDHQMEPASKIFGEQGRAAAAPDRRKRRRAKAVKNKEEAESQRMNHIAIERNRRKQMNDYLAALRSLMPASYVQRGDQASIIGGAINYVKELEQLLQSLEAQKRAKQQHPDTVSVPFAGFFSFPQYTSSSRNAEATDMTGQLPATADIEVTMADSHANVRVLAPRRPKQLLKMVVGLQALRLTVLHLNVTSMDEFVLYTFSLKVEDDRQVSSVDDIAAAVYEMVGRVGEESVCN